MKNSEESPSDSSRPRIAMVSIHGYVAAQPSLGEADTGGQVIYVLELSKKLAELGFTVDIYTRRFEDQQKFERVADNVRIVRIPCGGNDFIPKEYMYEYTPEWVENTLAFIQQNEFSYEFINSHYWDAGDASMELSQSLDTPHVHTPHSLGQWKLLRMREEYDQNPDAFEQKYNFTTRIESEKEIYQSALAVTATSSVQADIISEQYGVAPENIHIIPPGYDKNRFSPVNESKREEIRKRWEVEDKNVVITLGRLASNKGYDLLIDAFEHVAGRVPDAELHLALGGKTLNDKEQELLDSFKQKAEELNIIDRIKFKTFIPDEELPNFYRMADVFVLPSRYEPFGMTAIEAMACETSSVVTTRGGLWQELKHGTDTLFSDVMDKEDLGATITKLLRFPSLRKRVAENGAQTVLQKFTWTNISQKLVKKVNESLETPKEEKEKSSRPTDKANINK